MSEPDSHCEQSEYVTKRIVRTTCPMDCPDTCSILALRHGDSIRLYGDRDNPITRGYLCAKMRKFPGRLANSPTRLKNPRIRTSNGWEDISTYRNFNLDV